MVTWTTRRGVAVVGGVLVLACGPSVSSESVTTPDGRPGIRVECWFEKQDCDPEARRVCPQGFRVVDASEHFIPNGTPTSGGRMLYRMTLECYE